STAAPERGGAPRRSLRQEAGFGEARFGRHARRPRDGRANGPAWFVLDDRGGCITSTGEGETMETGQWVRRGSTITLHDTGPSTGPSLEGEQFFSDLVSDVSGWAQRGADYIGSRFGSPAVAPTAPGAAPSAPS